MFSATTAMMKHCPDLSVTRRVSLICCCVFLLIATNARAFATIDYSVSINDPDVGLQTYLNKVRASQAWNIVQQHIQKRDVIVAVLDTGVDISHPDLRANLWINPNEIPGDGIDNDTNSYIDDVNGWDFLKSIPDPSPKLDPDFIYDAVNHGTVMAGILAAEHNNGLGIAGAGIGFKIMPLRVFDGKGTGSTTLLAQAIDYAVENGADVINLSVVGEVNDPRLEKSISAAYKSGVAIVAASGNQEPAGVNLNSSPRYPVCDYSAVNEIIGVAALDEQNTVAPFSNYGSKCIDISAPGTNFYSTVWHIDNNPQFSKFYSGGWNGSSAAAPLVSATLAMMREIAPTISVADMYRALLTSAASLEQTDANFKDLGSGLLDMSRALDTALQYSRENPLHIILAQGKGFDPKIIIKDKDGVTISEFSAYASQFKGGVSIAVGDVDGDGNNEIVTVPLSGGGPHVRIFDMNGTLKGQFMAFDKRITGGFSVAVGDVMHLGQKQIIVSQMSGGQPAVRVFDAHGAKLSEFIAYAPLFSGGVQVLSGDADGDHRDEIITTPASSGGPHVRIFDGKGNLRSQFMALDPSYRGRITIGIGDVDSDGQNELITAPVTDHDAQIRIFDYHGSEKNRFLAYSEIDSVQDPINLIVADYTGDGQSDIVAYPLIFGARLKVYDFYGHVIDTPDFSGTTKDASVTRFAYALSH